MPNQQLLGIQKNWKKHFRKQRKWISQTKYFRLNLLIMVKDGLLSQQFDLNKRFSKNLTNSFRQNEVF